MRFLLLLLFSTFFGIVTGQVNYDTFSIKITESIPTVFPHEFISLIDKKGDRLKIVYSAIDSFDRAGYLRDENVKRMLATYVPFDTSNLKPYIEHQHLLDSLLKMYCYYDRDSLLLKTSNNIAFINLLKKIISTPKEILENREETKKIAVLDGENYSFIIETNQQKKYVYAYPFLSPVLHPLLYQLFTEVKNIYKLNKQKDFLNKRNMVGY